METLALTTPGSPLVSPQGTPGATSITYKILATNASGHSDASQGTTVTTAAATLTGTDFNRLTWQAVPGASGYDIYRTVTAGVSPTTVGKIGSSTAATFDDTGLAGDAVVAPTTNTSGIDSPFWTEQELLDLLILGCKDLWKGIVDLHQGHFVKIDDTGTVIYPAGTSGVTTSFTGIPEDCFRVLMVEPKDLGATGSTVIRSFRPRQFQSRTFQAARAMSVQDSSSWLEIYYDILNAGSPVGAPLLVGAPPVSSAVPIRLTYVKTLPTLVETDYNPIGGESDNALIAWTVAYAKAKENEQRMPDAGWLAIYSTEKQGLLTVSTPRQEQEEEEVESLFGDCW
jgi:hypothetical protein